MQMLMSVIWNLMVAMEMPHVLTTMEALNVYAIMGMMEMGFFVQVCYLERERERERMLRLIMYTLLNPPIFLDVDECSEGVHTCDSNAVCNNTNGGFECACLLGYEGDGLTCESKYTKINTVDCEEKTNY